VGAVVEQLVQNSLLLMWFAVQLAQKNLNGKLVSVLGLVDFEVELL